MSTVYTILNLARTHLNDDSRLLWTDAKLIPKLQVAQRELESHFLLNGVSYNNETSVVLDVTADDDDGVLIDLSLNVSYPTDLIEPIKLFERKTGELEDDFRLLTERSYLDGIAKSDTHRFWCWKSDKIFLLGAMADAEVKVQYRKGVTLQSRLTETVVPIAAELYYSYKIAALASKDNELSGAADMALDRLVRLSIKGTQGITVRRKPWNSSRRPL